MPKNRRQTTDSYYIRVDEREMYYGLHDIPGLLPDIN